MKHLLYSLLLTSSILNAQQLGIKYGVGTGNSAKKSKSETLFGAVSYQNPINILLIQQIELGYWKDARTEMRRKSSAYGSYSLGLNLDIEYLYVQALWGIAAISNTDSYLGGPLQFNHDFGIGFQDARNVSLGLSYKHLSSAGIFKPNVGRDFLTIRVGIPFSL